jgi:hypothetical protein
MLSSVSTSIILVLWRFTSVLTERQRKRTTTIAKFRAVLPKPPPLIACERIHRIQDQRPNSRSAFGGESLSVQIEQNRIEVRFRLSASRTGSYYDVTAHLNSSDGLLLVAEQATLWIHCCGKTRLKPDAH